MRNKAFNRERVKEMADVGELFERCKHRLDDEQKIFFKNYESLFLEIEHKLAEKHSVVIGIDGNCGAGKTTLARLISKVYSCDVISADHFFLPFELRNEKRLSEPGGNIDYERFLQQAITPLLTKRRFCYKPYNCALGGFDAPVAVRKSAVNVIEGSYCLHPMFQSAYDIKVFLSIEYSAQLARIKARNGEEKLQDFINKWIPLENKYFEHFKIKENCDIVF